MRRSRAVSAPLLAVLLLLSVGAGELAAWGDLEHQAVAEIAWRRLSPEAAAEAARILERMPADADLAAPWWSWGERRRRLLFQRAASWPDLVKDFDRPERRQRYHRDRWHYVNLPWANLPWANLPWANLPWANLPWANLPWANLPWANLPWGDGASESEECRLAGERLEPPHLVERLGALADLLAGGGGGAQERALALAWLIHLVGDIHQPLHAGTRLRDPSDAPAGDRGGNDFPLGSAGNLHLYWDLLFSARRRPPAPSRLADSLLDRYGSPGGGEAAAADSPAAAAEAAGNLFAAWARESCQLARREVYLLPPAGNGARSPLPADQPPPPVYRERATEIAGRRMVLAGERLAALLDSLLVERPGAIR